MTKPRIHTPAEIAEAARRRRLGEVPLSQPSAPAVDNSLEGRIAARLREALEQQVRGGFTVPGAHSGLAVVEPGGSGAAEIVLSLDDVARIAAQVAEG
jgi:hypothetical protein